MRIHLDLLGGLAGDMVIPGVPEILRFDDPNRIFENGGAMEALVEAKQAGKIRFIGFTGHKVADALCDLGNTAI